MLSKNTPGSRMALTGQMQARGQEMKLGVLIVKSGPYPHKMKWNWNFFILHFTYLGGGGAYAPTALPLPMDMKWEPSTENEQLGGCDSLRMGEHYIISVLLALSWRRLEMLLTHCGIVFDSDEVASDWLEPYIWLSLATSVWFAH